MSVLSGGKDFRNRRIRGKTTLQRERIISPLTRIISAGMSPRVHVGGQDCTDCHTGKTIDNGYQDHLKYFVEHNLDYPS